MWDQVGLFCLATVIAFMVVFYIQTKRSLNKHSKRIEKHLEDTEKGRKFNIRSR